MGDVMCGRCVGAGVVELRAAVLLRVLAVSTDSMVVLVWCSVSVSVM